MRTAVRIEVWIETGEQQEDAKTAVRRELAGEQDDVTTTGTRAESHGGKDGGGGCGIHFVDASADTFSGYLHGFILLIPLGYLCGTFVDTSGNALPTSFPEPAFSYAGVPSRLWIVHKEVDSK